MVRGNGSIYPPHATEMEKWLETLSKAADNEQVNPAVLKEVLSDLKVIWIGLSGTGLFLDSEDGPEDEGDPTGLF